jgi:hypothetical protein
MYRSIVDRDRARQLYANLDKFGYCFRQPFLGAHRHAKAIPVGVAG